MIGKTHLAQALGYEAIKQGKEVLYRSIFDLVRDFLKDEAFKQQDKTLRRRKLAEPSQQCEHVLFGEQESNQAEVFWL
jgi:DNA replication protein DnaC